MELLMYLDQKLLESVPITRFGRGSIRHLQEQLQKKHEHLVSSAGIVISFYLSGVPSGLSEKQIIDLRHALEKGEDQV